MMELDPSLWLLGAATVSSAGAALTNRALGSSAFTASIMLIIYALRTGAATGAATRSAFTIRTVVG